MKNREIRCVPRVVGVAFVALLLFAGCGDDSENVDASVDQAVDQSSSDQAADQATDQGGDQSSSDQSSVDQTADSCVSSSATPGPSCTTTADCFTANYAPCTQECVGCGCLCSAGTCYNLLDWNCPVPDGGN